MLDTPASEETHDSGDEHNGSQSKGPANKDKECQYCHLHFTSSSLGRHLDQFISKKKPDGIHDVDEIRRLRGGITRRIARGGKRDIEDSHSSRPSPGPPTSIKPTFDQLNRAPPGGVEARLNRLNWQSTGVITDPNTFMSSAVASPAVLPSPSRKKRSFSTFAQDISPATAIDTARALELSLREVLDTLRAANKHATPTPSPFTFDIQTQTFPSLCLAMLPTPPTLFQPSPFSTLQTIPISPPGPDQLQPLRSKLTSTIDAWKWQALRLAQPTTSNIADEADFLTRSAAEYTESALTHLDSSYQNWMAHPPEIRSALWSIELLRAVKTEQDKVADLEERVERVQQEANQLQQQVEYLSRCQWPREMALWPPERHIFDKAMREELRLAKLTKTPNGNDGGDEVAENVNTRGDKWDFDKLVNKWKAHVKEDRDRRMPFVSAQNAAAAVSAGVLMKAPDGTATPPIKSKSNSETNGVGASNGGSPANGASADERRKSSRHQKKNVSIISDL